MIGLYSFLDVRFVAADALDGFPDSISNFFFNNKNLDKNFIKSIVSSMSHIFFLDIKKYLFFCDCLDADFANVVFSNKNPFLRKEEGRENGLIGEIETFLDLTVNLFKAKEEFEKKVPFKVVFIPKKS